MSKQDTIQAIEKKLSETNSPIIKAALKTKLEILKKNKTVEK